MASLPDDTMHTVFAHIFAGPLFTFKRLSLFGPCWKSVAGTHNNHSLCLSPSRELVKTALVCRSANAQLRQSM